MPSSRFGVEDHVCECFHYNLSGRMQIFTTPAYTADADAVLLICVVPQGSVVGPPLFTAYGEDFEDLIETFFCEDHILADDTHLLAHTRLTEVLRCVRILRRCVDRIQD